MKHWKRRCLVLTGIPAILYATACVYLWAVQVDQVFVPMQEIPTTPDRMGMAYTRVKIPVGTAGDRQGLDGFWVPSGDAAGPVFLYLHGQDATIGKNLEHTHRLHQLGYSVLLIDYRGFGESFGKTKPSEQKVREDAEAAWDYLLTTQSCRPDQIFIFGHSLGGAIAIDLAIRHPDAAGLIAESTFTSVLEMSRLQYHGLLRALPMDLLLHQRFDSIDKIGELKIPVLLIHGDKDPRIPHTMSEELFRAAPEPKELLLIEGGGHANSGSIGMVEYKRTIGEFVSKHQDGAEQGGAGQPAADAEPEAE